MLLPLAMLLLAPQDFGALKGQAQEVESLKKTVSVLVGDCEGAEYETAVACQQNRASEEKKLRKDKHYIYLGVPEASLIQYGGMKGGKARLLWVPMVDAGEGYALSVGKPLRLDKNGSPVFKKMVVDITLAPGVLESDVQRAMRLGMLSIEVVGGFGKKWSMKKGGKTATGVSFKLDGLRVLNARNGKVLGEM